MSLNGVYNRYDKTKNWVSINFIPGRRLQTAELNELQSILNHKIDTMLDAMFGNMSFLTKPTLTYVSETEKLLVTPCTIYSCGYLFELTETYELSVGAVSPSDLKSVLAIVTTKTILPELDSSLLDPAVGYENYNEPGASRTVVELSFSVTNGSASDDPTNKTFVIGSIEGGIASFSRNIDSNVSIGNALTIVKTNVSVPVSSWVEDSTYSDSGYAYSATIDISGIDSNFYPEVTFGLADAISGKYSPIAATGSGTVTIYAKAIPEADMIIPTIIFTKAV